MRVRGEGESGEPGAAPGDLFITIHVREHEVFRREGHHLICERLLSFSQSALGTELQIPLLGGGDRTLKIPPGTQTGSLFRIRGQGVRDRAGSGDLVVRVRVRTPVHLSREGCEAMEALAATGDEDLQDGDRSLFQKVKDIFS